MKLECGWRHAKKRWSWEFEDFKNYVSWRLTLDHAGRWLSSLPLRQKVEVFLPLRRRLSFSGPDQWRWIEILNTTTCAERWSGVSTVWLQKTFKNCVFLLVLMNWNQEINKYFSIWNNRVRLHLRCVFVSVLSWRTSSIMATCSMQHTNLTRTLALYRCIKLSKHYMEICLSD